MIDLLDSLASRARRDPLRQPTHKTLMPDRSPSDRATPNMTCASHLAASVFSQTRSINLQWQSRSYNPSTRETSSFGGGPDGLNLRVLQEDQEAKPQTRAKSTSTHHKPPNVSPMVTICPTTNSRFVQWVTPCSHHKPPASFVPWVTTCFRKTHLHPRSKNSFGEIPKEQDSQKPLDWVSSSSQRIKVSLCTEIQVPSPSRGGKYCLENVQAVELRNGHVNHKNSHQRSKERILFL